MHKQINDSFYLGLATDTKPTDVWVKEGSIFFETDTQNVYILNIARNWVTKDILGGIKFIDESGVLYGNRQVDNKLRVSSMPYLYDVAEGNVPGHIFWQKIGYNASVGTSQEDLWPVGGIYVPPAAEMQMEIVSSSTDDDLTGTGIQKVKIWYLDDTFTEKTEIVDLDGTNVVTTIATDIYRVNHFRAYACGTGGQAAGNIDIRHLDDTPIYGRIETGYTRARTAFYTIPKDKFLYIFNVMASSGGTAKPVRVTTRAKFDNLENIPKNFFLPYNEVIVTDTVVDIPLELPTKFTEGVDLKVSAVSGQDGTLCSVSLRGWLEADV